MDHRLWMCNMHYETGVDLKPEFIDGVRNFIEHTMTRNFIEYTISVLDRHVKPMHLTSRRRRVAEQESMSKTVQQIKEQVMNLAHRPTTSAPANTGDESDEDDYVDLTP
ncbi:hypothetical protein H5410_037926 [Solanum commersonii]|uniref:Uncharacterized protein n=1 Tax=Solanum commersonii TaxID=4109 RepID=A0A9J5YCI7_SOLCO|nr:hypothetical protein H5410_037926 [Solanum commersonii]